MDLRYFIGLARNPIEVDEWFTGIAHAGREVIPVGWV
jgi:hypothetical protein